MNTISKKWQDYSCLLIYISAALLAVSDTGIQLLILNTIGPHSRILRQAAFCLCIIKVLGTRYRKKEFLIIAPIMALSVYNYTFCGNDYIIWNILIIAAMKDIDFSVLFKTLFFSTFSTLLLIGVLSFLGVGGAFSLTMDYGRGGVETRYCFGLYQPNIWHFAFARSVVYFVLGFRSSRKWYCLFSLLLINYIAYRFTISRTGFLTTTGFLLMIFAYRYLPKLMNHTLMKFLITSGLLAVFCTFLYFLYDFSIKETELGNWVNQKLTTGRIQQAYYVLCKHPVRFWGSRFPDDGTLFDFGFLRMFYESGYLLAAIGVLAFILLLIYALRTNNGLITAVCIFMALYSLYEAPPVTRPSYNILIFFFAILIYGNEHFKGSVS